MKRPIDWNYHFRQQAKSGESAAEYCRIHALSIRQFYNRRAKQRSTASKEADQFVSLIPSPSKPVPPTGIALDVSQDGSVQISGRLPSLNAVKELFGALS